MEDGFTLIELLVVVIIIGVLSAVALPNLLGQVGKARETEAKNSLGTINRAQQAYHFEKGTWSPSYSPLGLAQANALGITIPESKYYSIGINTTPASFPGAAYAFAAGKDLSGTIDYGKSQGTRDYKALVEFDPSTGQYSSGICQADVSGQPAEILSSTACDVGSTYLK